MASNPADERALVGIPQIAEIAGVGRSAVGNWRKRHPDFPAPKVQTPSGALFDLREVEDWLIEQGKISQRAPASARLWAMADAARALWMPDEFVRFGVAFLVYREACARSAPGSSPEDDLQPEIPARAGWSALRGQSPKHFLRAFTQAARDVEAMNPDLVGLLDMQFAVEDAAVSQLAHQVALTLDAAAPDQSARCALFESLADLESADRFSGEYSTPADVARLVAGVVDYQGGTIVDPAVGEGRLLWQTAYGHRSADATPAAVACVVGTDINADACRRTRSRFYLYGQPAGVRNEDALRVDPASLPLADVVVVDPPYGLGNWGDADIYVNPRWRFGSPPPSSADFAWLQFAALHLKPTGRAAVLMGLGSLWKGGREGPIRQKMVEAGVVEAVITLSPRLRSNTSIPLALWLLRSSAAPVNLDEILLVDASKLAATGRSRFSLPEPEIQRLVQVVTRWRTTNDVSPEDGDIAISVPVADVLRADADLNPARYRGRPEVDLGAVEQKADELRLTLRASAAAATNAYEELLNHLESRR